MDDSEGAKGGDSNGPDDGGGVRKGRHRKNFFYRKCRHGAGAIGTSYLMSGLRRGPAELGAAARHPDQKNLYLLTAPARAGAGDIDQAAFRELFPQIRERFDYCLIDAPAGLGSGFQLALAGADRAVVVTTTEASSLRDAQRTVMELNWMGRGQVHLVVNRCKRKLLKSLHQTIDDAIDGAGRPLLGVIPEDETIPLYAGRGVPLLCTTNNCSAQAYRNIARRIDGRHVPLMKIR